jgi:eukaryotic-like serine/threonine-protein kinase
MGEVYRPQDARVGRDVAIKVSAGQFTDRFKRKTRIVASLNHFDICNLHDVIPNCLVMELVKGPTLADRITQGAIPLKELWGIANDDQRELIQALVLFSDRGLDIVDCILCTRTAASRYQLFTFDADLNKVSIHRQSRH